MEESVEVVLLVLQNKISKKLSEINLKLKEKEVLKCKRKIAVNWSILLLITVLENYELYIFLFDKNKGCKKMKLNLF